MAVILNEVKNLFVALSRMTGICFVALSGVKGLTLRNKTTLVSAAEHWITSTRG